MKNMAGNNHEEPASIQPIDTVPLTPEQALNTQILAFNQILENIKLLYLTEDEIELDFPSSPDVLSKKDYPTGYLIFEDFIRRNNNFHAQYKLPIQSIFSKRIMREHLTRAEHLDPRRNTIVKPSKRNPQCFRYLVEVDGLHLGDIFIIPIIVKRTVKQAFIDKKPQFSFETIIVAADSSSSKKARNRKRIKDVIIADINNEQDLSIIGFSEITNQTIHTQNNSDTIGQYFTDVFEEWITDHIRQHNDIINAKRRYKNGWAE